MKIIQMVPEMNVGGVELVTLELARYFTQLGHQSVVISHGGSLVPKLLAAGSRHIALPVHRKHPASLLQVRKLRKVLEDERPEILQIASRVPGWLAWLAWRGMNPKTRPRLVSTVHGFYSVNAYSAVMTRGERVICVSESIRDYVLKNYPSTLPARVKVIHGGIDSASHASDFQPSAEWLAQWQAAQPQLTGKALLLLPGRITRLKGHADFFQLIVALKGAGLAVHGLVAGDVQPKKRAYLAELQALVKQLRIEAELTFLGHRSDIREVMAVSDLVYALSKQPEAFGRTVLEALALGKPVIGYDCGGVAELLTAIFPAGKIPLNDVLTASQRTLEILCERPAIGSTRDFTLARANAATLAVYTELLASPR
jgi:glycosyltransferase involved in cell wall biosynthesis